jgi:HPt (histidine-containing phosphotransfer) domain-containing protein
MNSGPPQSDGTRALLSRLWQRSLPLLLERLAVLDAAATASRAGTLTPDLRARAIDEAHKLAGSLGMFGYPDGTDLARKIELLLEAPNAPPPNRLTELAAELRAILFPPT